MAVHDLARDGDGVAVEPLQQVLPADQAEPLAVAVIGEGEHHVGAAAHELLVKLLHHFGVVDHHFGHIASRLEVAAPLHLEQVAAAVDDRLSGGQAFHERSGHDRPPLSSLRESLTGPARAISRFPTRMRLFASRAVVSKRHAPGPEPPSGARAIKAAAGRFASPGAFLKMNIHFLI